MNDYDAIKGYIKRFYSNCTKSSRNKYIFVCLYPSFVTDMISKCGYIESSYMYMNFVIYGMIKTGFTNKQLN